MKIYFNSIVTGKYLRTGLSVLCFSVMMCAAGCGKTDPLLSELREEDETQADSGFGSEESDVPDEAPEGVAGEDEADFSGTADANAGDEASGQAEQKICVHVCGAVKTPGVYELPAGSRFYEAVEAAGGFAEGACEDYLNMAALLADGSRLEIPTSEEIREEEAADSYYTLAEEKGAASDGKEAAGGEKGGSGADASGTLVNINTADADGLCRLPGVGEGRAKAIIEYREKQGGFRKKEDIMQVSGIGEKMYARMEEYLTVE